MDNVVDRFFEVTVSADRLVFAFDWLAVAAKSWIIKSPGYIAVAQRLIDSQECDLQWPDILSAIQISKSRLEGHFIEVPKARGRTTHHLPKIDDPFFDSAYRECRHIWIFRIVSTLFWAEFLLHAFSHWQNNFAKIFKLNCLSNMYEGWKNRNQRHVLRNGWKERKKEEKNANHWLCEPGLFVVIGAL